MKIIYSCVAGMTLLVRDSRAALLLGEQWKPALAGHRVWHDARQVKRWSVLNDRQLSLLKRVAGGDDLSGPDSLRDRQSAYALSNRGLIEVSKRGGVFRAQMTGAGRFYLAEGRHPDQPTRSGADEPPSASPRRRRAPEATMATAARRMAEATELVERLVAERKVTVVKPTEGEVVAWRKVVDFAKRHGLVPEGQRIEKLTTWKKDLEISLVTGVHPNTGRTVLLAEAPVIPIPDSLRQCHPVIAQLRDDERRMTMPQEQRRRSLLLLQAVAAEAERRGHIVQDQTKDPYGYYKTGNRVRAGRIKIVINGFDFEVAVAQVSPGATDPERREPLALEVPAYRTGQRQTRWADGKRRKVEDVLATVFQELELQATEAAQRKADEQRAKDERQRQWEAAMAKARESAIFAFYVKILEKQHKQWREAERLREYLAALEERLVRAAAEDDPGAEKAREWMIFVKAYVMTLDPLNGVPAMPDPPSLTNDDLKPFLGGWSPYGPG